MEKNNCFFDCINLDDFEPCSVDCVLDHPYFVDSKIKYHAPEI